MYQLNSQLYQFNSSGSEDESKVPIPDSARRFTVRENARRSSRADDCVRRMDGEEAQHIKNRRRRFFQLRNDGSLLGFKTQPYPELLRAPQKPVSRFTVEECQVMCRDKGHRFTFMLRGLRREKTIEWTFSVSSNEERTARVS